MLDRQEIIIADGLQAVQDLVRTDDAFAERAGVDLAAVHSDERSFTAQCMIGAVLAMDVLDAVLQKIEGPQLIFGDKVEIAGVKVNVVRDERFVRISDEPTLVGDNSRLKSLGWQQEYTIKQTLEAVFKDWMNRV